MISRKIIKLFGMTTDDFVRKLLWPRNDFSRIDQCSGNQTIVSNVTSGCSSWWCLRMNRSDSGQLAGRPWRNERFRFVSVVVQIGLVQRRKSNVVDLRLRQLLQRLLHLLLLKLILNEEVVLAHHRGVHVVVFRARAVVVVVSASQRGWGNSDALIGGRGRVVENGSWKLLLLLLNDAHYWNS